MWCGGVWYCYGEFCVVLLFGLACVYIRLLFFFLMDFLLFFLGATRKRCRARDLQTRRKFLFIPTSSCNGFSLFSHRCLRVHKK